MKLTLQKPQRIVDYFGLQLVVPYETEYLSTDDEGSVMAHSLEPWTEPNFWEGYELGYVAKIKLPADIHWRDTLLKYECEEVDDG